MYAVRFHGRGGQGAKTASRILGTAAFLSGYQGPGFPHLRGRAPRGAGLGVHAVRPGADPRARGYGSS
jgi:pyruvate ferredoxin oxidoreductase gamma subunit